MMQEFKITLTQVTITVQATPKALPQAAELLAMFSRIKKVNGTLVIHNTLPMLMIDLEDATAHLCPADEDAARAWVRGVR